MSADESVVGGGRFGTDVAGYRSMLEVARRWPDRVWAIEGCRGIGRHVSLRLLADGQEVVDVPPVLVGPGQGLLDRPGPEDRRHRRPLSRTGCDPDGRAASGGQ